MRLSQRIQWIREMDRHHIEETCKDQETIAVQGINLTLVDRSLHEEQSSHSLLGHRFAGFMDEIVVRVSFCRRLRQIWRPSDNQTWKFPWSHHGLSSRNTGNFSGEEVRRQRRFHTNTDFIDRTTCDGCTCYWMKEFWMKVSKLDESVLDESVSG